jgi:hypothetical protein
MDARPLNGGRPLIAIFSLAYLLLSNPRIAIRSRLSLKAPKLIFFLRVKSITIASQFAGLHVPVFERSLFLSSVIVATVSCQTVDLDRINGFSRTELTPDSSGHEHSVAEANGNEAVLQIFAFFDLFAICWDSADFWP